MSTYLVHGDRLYLAEAPGPRQPAEGAPEVWRIEGGVRVPERRFTLREIEAPLTVRIYGSCPACDPVLASTRELSSGDDVVKEHGVPVSFRLTFSPGGPVRVERTSGTRDDLRIELLGRGIRVLDDDEPLALAHRAMKRRASG